MEATEITVPEMIEKALATYSPSDAAIAELRANYMPLTVKDESDKEGYALVRAARLDIKEKRVVIEKCRVGLKEGALRYGQAVDAEARRLTNLLTPIEAHLKQQEDIVALAVERRKAAEEAARLARLRDRMTTLRDAGSPLLAEDVNVMTDEAFNAALADAERAKATRIEAERVAAEQRRAESDRLAAERAEIEQQRAGQERVQREREAAAEVVRQQQAAEAKRLADERAAIEAERAAQQRQADIKAAEERAAKQAREDAKREAERQAEAERQREAMRTVNEKLLSIAVEVEALASIVPDFKHDDEVRAILARAAADIRAIVARKVS